MFERVDTLPPEYHLHKTIMSLIFILCRWYSGISFSSKDENSKGDAYETDDKLNPPKYSMFRMVGGEQDTPPYHNFDNEFHSQ